MYLNVIVCLLMQGAPKLIQNLLFLILFLNFEPLFLFFEFGWMPLDYLATSFARQGQLAVGFTKNSLHYQFF